MSHPSKIVLGIEAAIDGGSLFLTRDANPVDGWTGEGTVSRAEKVLPNIDSLLAKNGLTVRDIDTIAVSVGPGSYTGIRIGIATALGLRMSVGVKLVGMTMLQAISFAFNRGKRLVAVPTGRQFICLQEFKGDVALTNAELIHESNLM